MSSSKLMAHLITAFLHLCLSFLCSASPLSGQVQSHPCHRSISLPFFYFNQKQQNNATCYSSYTVISFPRIFCCSMVLHLYLIVNCLSTEIFFTVLQANAHVHQVRMCNLAFTIIPDWPIKMPTPALGEREVGRTKVQGLS